MDRLLIAAAFIVVAVGVALIMRRRKPDPPTQPAWTVPAQLDRADFVRADAPWLVAVFTSSTCASCADLLDKALPLESAAVAVQDIEFVERRDLHERYAIDAVPTVVIADGEGVVRGSFVGPVTAADLWATVAELREPGSTPPACDHGQPG